MANNLTIRDIRFLNDKIEKDIYQPTDNRTWKSYIEDVYEGDNFADFCEEYFELLDKEEYWD